MIRKTALFVALIAAALATQPVKARRCRPYMRVYHRPAPVYVQPYYCPQPWGYYPVYPQPVCYVDYRDPEVALIQDGMNLFFNAISCSRR